MYLAEIKPKVKVRAKFCTGKTISQLFELQPIFILGSSGSLFY